MHTIAQDEYHLCGKCTPSISTAWHHRHMTQPKRKTKSSIQVSVRLPLKLYDMLKERGPVAGQIVEAAKMLLSREDWAPCGTEPWEPRP